MNSARLYSIENEYLRLTSDSEIGATITDVSLRREECWYPLMRPAPNPLDRSSNGSFIMAPYSNRIKNGLFRYADKDYQLKFPEKHAIHGDVRDRAWSLSNRSASHLEFCLGSSSYPDFNFPFKLSFVARYELIGKQFLHQVLIKNEDSVSVPVGGGFHPYFMRRLFSATENVVLTFDAQGVYLYEGDIPLTDSAPVDLPEKLNFKTPQSLSEGIDNLYYAWNRKAEMYWPESEVKLHYHANEGMDFLVLFAPPEKNYFALEPVSMVTDGFNRLSRGETDTGVKELKPTESVIFGARLTLES